MVAKIPTSCYNSAKRKGGISMTDQTLGQRISDGRKKLGLSQEALGERMGVSRQAISKWESDGAIPEIDKLIALSRLFGVSVDRLLGQETAPAQQEPILPDSSPKQPLKQVVRNHLADHPWWRTAAWIIIALSMVFIAFSSFVRLRRITRAEIEADILHSNVNRLEHQLRYLEALSQAASQTGPLLASCAFDLTLSENSPEATVTFTAEPHSWQETDQGFLSVIGSGVVPLHIPCQWDGTALTASVTLPFADGYELHFTQTHSDGSLQMQPLSHSLLETLKTSCAITSFGSIGESSYNRFDNTLRMDNFQYSYHRPELYTDSPVVWQKIRLVLFRDGQEIWQQTDFDAAARHDSTLTSGGGSRRGTFRLDLGDIKPESGQTLELKLYASLSNTVTAETTIARWLTDKNGIPILTTD